MKKLAWMLLLVIALGLGIWFWYTKPLPVTTAVVQKGNFQQVITATGETAAKSSYVIAMPFTGELSRIELQVGNSVKKDQVIASLTSGYKIRAPISGKIVRLFQQSAGLIPAGKPLMEIADLKQLEVVVPVLSTEATQIPLRATAIITQWGGDYPLKGRVRTIEPIAHPEVSALGVKEQRVRVLIDLTTQPLPAQLGFGYRVDTKIILLEVPNVPLIPMSALFQQGSTWATYRVKDGRALLQSVTLKWHNNEIAVPREGVNIGDQVILYPNDQLKTGSRIRLQTSHSQ